MLFKTQERETRVKFNPGLSANRPSNNWAQKRNGPLLGSERQASVEALRLNRYENNPRSILTILRKNREL